ncbi:unnamed protein product [Spirodela intermedia]|uniref:Uncharacterized protein n=1 Tax=Spirodela intermedia TaxID=51605 RepID=A0A7I8J682_SPIIN|nr:unnamed protein product [Spirodela intermedia]CAA6665746.1 unnamed protein product [Spirodela intermedia]
MRETVPEPSAATESPATCERPRNLEVLPQQMTASGGSSWRSAPRRWRPCCRRRRGNGGSHREDEDPRQLGGGHAGAGRKARPGGGACKSPVVHYLERS